MDNLPQAELVTREARRSCGDVGPFFHWIAPAVAEVAPEWAEYYAEQMLLQKKLAARGPWLAMLHWRRVAHGIVYDEAYPFKSDVFRGTP